MLEHLPWIIVALAVGLFVGYSFGRYRGATRAAGELEEEVPGDRPSGAGGAISEADADSTVTVYLRRGGTHYHKESCRHLHGRGYAVGKTAALKKKYKPCPSCRP